MFGGEAGPLRLLNEALGSQGGWLVGAAVGSAMLLLAATRLRRSDARTGWLILLGGAFATTAVAFSFASGIFHPYYVSELAPLTAALFGAGVGVTLQQVRGSSTERSRLLLGLGGGALILGAITEAVVLNDATQLRWLAPVLVGAAVSGAVALQVLGNQRARMAVLGTVTALLLVAPGVWSAQTLGHATSGTFPTGGPSSLSAMGGPGGGMGGGPSGGGPGGMGMPGQSGGVGMPPGMSTSAGGAASQSTTTSSSAAVPSGMGGGMFGGDQSTVTSAVSYAQANGGGTIVVSGQMGAANAILGATGQVAGIGGFSGRESEVSVSWFADRVADGSIRWVVTSSGGLQDSRTGSNTVMGAVAESCTAVSSVSGLYDCEGAATALRTAAS